MANEPTITLVGNLTDDAELRFIPSGAAVANFTVASTPRVKNGDQWEDGEPMFVRCAAWRDLAENVAESLTKGTRVIVQGRLSVRSFEHNGEKRTSMELDVDAVGPELRFATASVTRASRGGGGNGGSYGGGQGYGQPQGQGYGQRQQQPAADPWATPGQTGPNDEPPF